MKAGLNFKSVADETVAYIVRWSHDIVTHLITVFRLSRKALRQYALLAVFAFMRDGNVEPIEYSAGRHRFFETNRTPITRGNRARAGPEKKSDS